MSSLQVSESNAHRTGLYPALTIFSFFLGLMLTGCGPKPLPPEVANLVQSTVEIQPDDLPASVRGQKERVRAWKETQAFYSKRQFQPAWSNEKGPLPQADELLSTIDKLGSEGLDVRRYSRDRLAAQVQQVKDLKSYEDPQAQHELVDLDVELTYTFLTLAAHVATGRLQPETLRIDWYTKPRNVDLDVKLAEALGKKGEMEKVLRGLAPPSEDYARLRTALASYREQAAQGGWPQVPEGPTLKKGDRGVRVQALRARLLASQDLPAAQPNPSGQGAGGAGLFDDALAAGVARFQARHGLDPTGVVDADTLDALNVPLSFRISQMVANLERWRWMPSSLGERYILVNVPEFRMDLVEGDRTALTMRVVVGKTQSQTPVFSDQMTYLELNPSWNLPATITRDEIVPKLASDPGYLTRNNIEVVKGNETVDPYSVDLSQLGQSGSEYRLRQAPGAANPLGQVKFMFPNQFDVYLHDTPADHLFSREERDFSHGCIRLEKPVELADYLLKDDPKWTPQAIQAALTTDEPVTVQLKKPLPVHILYWTAWVEKDGTVQFRKDIYGHDAALFEALDKEPPVWLDLSAVRGEVQAAK